MFHVIHVLHVPFSPSFHLPAAELSTWNHEATKFWTESKRNQLGRL